MNLELSHLFHALPGLVWTALPDGRVEFVNQRWCDYTGLSQDQAFGLGWQSAIHPDDLARMLQAWHSFLDSGKPGEGEARLRRHDGEYRRFLFRANPICDESGSINRWLGINTDIEDRKRAEESLAASGRELRSIVNTIPTLAWSADPDGSADFVNQRWLDYTGLSAQQAQGWGWRAAIHPDDVNGLLQHWQACLASGTPIEAEARMRRFDASYRWFLFRANPLRDEAGRISKWYGTNIDIEDRRRVEEALRASEFSWRQIVDNIPGLVATTGAMGEVEFLNRQTLEYFGKTNEDLKNWALIGVVHPDDLPRVIEARQKTFETGQIYEVEHRCLRADGVYRWFQVRGLPVRDANNEITGWYLLLTDIDDRKRAQDALFSATLEARVGERTRIARELHDTLLQSFQGLLLRFQSALDLLPDQPVQAREALAQALDEAEQAITEGRDAVQGLRASTLETNGLALALKSFGEGLAADQGHTRAAAVMVEVEGTPRTLHPILRDEIYRIGCEAIRNAFRHAAARRIEVELRYDERQFRLRASDDGKGIDPAYLGEKGRPGHFGLRGMRERAQLIGGTLTIWSAPDTGTDVELIIPAVRAYTPSPDRRSRATRGSR